MRQNVSKSYEEWKPVFKRWSDYLSVLLFALVKVWTYFAGNYILHYELPFLLFYWIRCCISLVNEWMAFILKNNATKCTLKCMYFNFSPTYWKPFIFSFKLVISTHKISEVIMKQKIKCFLYYFKTDFSRCWIMRDLLVVNSISYGLYQQMMELPHINFSKPILKCTCFLKIMKKTSPKSN